MIDLDAMLRRALRSTAADDVTVATPYDLPERVCRELLAQGMIASVVANHARTAHLDRWCGGWWVDRNRGQIHLRRDRVETLLIAGVERGRQVDAKVLLEARLKRVRRIVTADREGQLIEDLQVERALLDRLDRLERSGSLVGPSFDDAFEEMYARVGDRLRLPAKQFRGRRLALCMGTLGPGGAERQGSFTAVGAMQIGGWEVHVVCNHLDPPANFYLPYLERHGVRVFLIDAAVDEVIDPSLWALHAELGAKYLTLGFGDVFFQILRYAATLRSLRPCLVHCWTDYCNALCGTAAALVGVPGIVLSCRSVAPDHFHLFQPYMRPAYETLLQRRQAVLLNNSQVGADDYARWLGAPAGRVKVIHNGVEFPDRISPQTSRRIRHKYGIADGCRIVGSILRFSEEKQPRLLIEAACEMHARDSSLRFLFFGGGVQLEEMRAFVASRRLEDVIQLPGLTNESWNVLGAMDLFMLTSRMEGLPNVLIEAQASGIPVVCTGVGGMAETIVENETGICVREASATALATAALRILDDDDLRDRMSRSAVEHARREFSLQKMLEATQLAYRDALGVSDVSSGSAVKVGATGHRLGASNAEA